MNWVETMALLKEAGYTQPDIAKRCKCAQSTISDIARGANQHPRYEIGVVLQQLAVTAKRRLASRAKSAPAVTYGQSPEAKKVFTQGDDFTSIDNTSKG